MAKQRRGVFKRVANEASGCSPAQLPRAPSWVFLEGPLSIALWARRIRRVVARRVVNLLQLSPPCWPCSEAWLHTDAPG